MAKQSFTHQINAIHISKTYMQSWKNFIHKTIVLFFVMLFTINVSGQDAETRKLYNEKLNQAEKLFFEKKYPEAKNAFEAAGRILPDETHPVNRIKEINRILGIDDKPNAAFLAAAQKADKLYEGDKYEEALDAYIVANDILPDQERITDRILELHELIREKQTREKNFNAAMKRGNQLLANRQLEPAKEEFEKALSLNPGSDEARNQLAEISQTLNTIKQYQDALATADELYMEQDYQAAKSAYQQALDIQPNQAYPKNMMLRIEELVAKREQDEEALQQAYQQAIDNGDTRFEAGEYLSAKTAFEQAADLMPAQSYPRAKITEINNLLADMEVLEQQYADAIAQADGLFENEDYESALASYRRASTLKPTESYPTERMNEISNLLAERMDETFQDIIAAADQLFEEENYEQARSEYQKAVDLKPEEDYPQNQILAIDNLLAGLAETDAAYQSAIASADQFFEDENYEQAISEYQKAVDLKPEEGYPQNQIVTIDNLLAGLAETDAAYQSAITAADQLFEDENYEQAISEYQKAADLKPEEGYPQNQISAIDNLLTGLAETDAAYQSAIASADQLFEDENYEQAKTEYQKAVDLKPEEDYPQNQILAIDNILTGLAETDAAYQSAIASADQLFEDENYEQAISEYQKAVDLKPEEDYPQNQIMAIDNILTGLAETDAAYQSAITAADQLFEEENYEQAKADYQKATDLKPAEDYPQNQILAIDNILTGIAETQAAYEAAIALGDQFFAEQNYDEAKLEYEKATALKPEEDYPLAQLVEIDQLLAELAEKQEQFESFVNSGDFHFDAGNLQEAKVAYREALELFPDNSYALEQLKAVDDALRVERERVLKEYNAIITDADRYFNQRAYDNAINEYMKASEMLPNEAYPKNQIAEITRIIEENVVVDVVSNAEIVESNAVSKYNFDPVPRQGRRESYIVVKARNMSERDFRIFLNYGKDGTNNGGFVINIPNVNQSRDYIVKVGGQYRWFSEDNNWISLQPEGGNVEVTMIQISQE